jgi:magnesium transporter
MGMATAAADSGPLLPCSGTAARAAVSSPHATGREREMVTTRPKVRIARPVPPGSPPGVLTDRPGSGQSEGRIIAFGPDALRDEALTLESDIAALRAAYPVVWIDIDLSGGAGLLAQVGQTFGLHALALEDAAHTHQRPKVEDYEGYLFLVALMVSDGEVPDTEQVAFFLGDGFLVTVQERPGDCFGRIRDRITQGQGRLCQAGADYLCYALLDAIIDGYFPVLERQGEVLEDLEERIVADPDRAKFAKLHELKRNLLLLRRAIWPHREMINALTRDESGVIAEATRPFLRDCYDHTIQLIDIVEIHRELAAGLVDVHVSSVSMKLNEVMKVLTIVATVFMPLSFIASLYGMNFDRAASRWNMPELGWSFGYPFALGLMGASAAGLLWYIWRKGWLRRM